MYASRVVNVFFLVPTKGGFFVFSSATCDFLVYAKVYGAFLEFSLVFIYVSSFFSTFGSGMVVHGSVWG